MSARFSLDGNMIPRTVRRIFDERGEERTSSASQTAVMAYRGRKHVVRMVNSSPSGAMVIFPHVPHIGEEVSLQLIGHGEVPARVRWVREGRIGVNFESPLE